MKIKAFPSLMHAMFATADAGAGGTGGDAKPAGDGKPAGDEGGKPAGEVKPKADEVGKDGKPASDGKPADDGKNNQPPPAKKAPDKYELKLPDKSHLDANDVKAIETIARENNWTNDEAQLALQHHHDTMHEQAANFLAETTADKTYGGENLAKSQARAKAVIDRIRPATHPRAQAFRALLDKSGYGNHIEILSFLADLGGQLDEDGAAGGDGTSGATQEDAAAKLYGGSKK